MSILVVESQLLGFFNGSQRFRLCTAAPSGRRGQEVSMRIHFFTCALPDAHPEPRMREADAQYPPLSPGRAE